MPTLFDTPGLIAIGMVLVAMLVIAGLVFALVWRGLTR